MKIGRKFISLRVACSLLTLSELVLGETCSLTVVVLWFGLSQLRISGKAEKPQKIAWSAEITRTVRAGIICGYRLCVQLVTLYMLPQFCVSSCGKQQQPRLQNVATENRCACQWPFTCDSNCACCDMHTCGVLCTGSLPSVVSGH